MKIPPQEILSKADIRIIVQVAMSVGIDPSRVDRAIRQIINGTTWESETKAGKAEAERIKAERITPRSAD